MENQFVGIWTYRSVLNNPELSVDFNALEFGRGNLKIEATAPGKLKGSIYGPGWALTLKGAIQYGAPATLWFQGSGEVNGALWVYDYLCYAAPQIPNGKNQIPALVGTVTRAIPHPNGSGGTSPAGVVASFYAVLQP
ncbi:hypothetical protein N7U66_00245 [Lacinutrix neustonica]|uniref:Uncharacterized protein n=1 Tax=Lacinutrix neustonica TaxID=2980107 RepID=A0A9E8MWC4_9FLAO|nr:hypothetical protein [Lacinutrix neustonica]WAC02251.1 hypothetical protein N7U66_00245 [Lacinutrix neustonica]